MKLDSPLLVFRPGLYENHRNTDCWKISASDSGSGVLTSLVPLLVVRLTAELGDDVTLKCNVTNKGNIVVVEWTRPDLDPEYVFLYRDGRSDPDEQNPSFKDRVKFKTDISDGDVSLILENVKTTDSGSYHSCSGFDCCWCCDVQKKESIQTCC
uniref:Ig-like domain-containing protein n=1 Tax=Echeneis naucrates TaxID=173247 RepID=A0A665U236_ECHNA